VEYLMFFIESKIINKILNGITFKEGDKNVEI
jgi:hypothetical protein